MRRGRRRPNSQWRRLKANWRDTLLLLREFGPALLLFGLVITGAGLLYYSLAARAGQPLSNPLEGIYLALSLTYLQSVGDFPEAWYLELFYFAMPLIGLVILAQGVTEFGIALFNRRARAREWEVAVASTFDNHIVLVGLGHLGFRVMRELHKLEQEVVVIELNPDEALITSARAMDVPVIQADGTREAALTAAGVGKARAILLCTQNDSLNLQIAVKARSLNPRIAVVVRIFDDDFARALEEQFGFQAMSATGMAAPAFAAAAAGVDITRPITVEGQALSLARLTLLPRSGLTGSAVSQVEQKYQVSVVLVRHAAESDLHPAGERRLEAGDVLAVLGGPEQINALVGDN